MNQTSFRVRGPRAVKQVVAHWSWRFATSLRHPGCIVLMYHRIGRKHDPFVYLDVDEFRRQMAWLAANCDVIRPAELREAARRPSRTRPPVLLTFDDGNRDYHDLAYPVLKEFGMPALVFLITDYVDQPRLLWWDRLQLAVHATELDRVTLPWRPERPLRLGGVANDRLICVCENYLKSIGEDARAWLVDELIQALGNPPLPNVDRQTLTWDEVRATMDLTTYGGHTHTHPLMSQIDNARLEREIRLCRDRIRAETAVQPTFFAYPNGGSTADAKALLMRYGFDVAFSAVEGFTDEATDWLEVPRVAVANQLPTRWMATKSWTAAAPAPRRVPPKSASSLRVEILEDWTAIAALEPEWDALLRESAADSIFLTWEWIRSWAAVGTHTRPMVVCVRNGRGDLVGLAPLYQASLRLAAAIPYRVLRVMADCATGADYPDWIIQRDDDIAITSAIVQALQSRDGWDCLWMSNMTGWTSSVERIVAACRARGLHCRTRPRGFSYFVLPADRETYFRSLSRNKRQQLRAEVKRIMNRPTVDICRCDTEDQLPRFLEALFDLHRRRWQSRGIAGAFDEEPLESTFYRHFTRRAIQKGWLRFYGLRDAGEFKAVQIGYVYRNIYHQLQEGFDPSYLKGVGNVLRAKVIEACIEEGIEAYDFLGGITEHKRRWLGQERTGFDLLIGRFTLKNLPLFGGIWPSSRFMYSTSRPPADAEALRYQ